MAEIRMRLPVISLEATSDSEPPSTSSNDDMQQQQQQRPTSSRSIRKVREIKLTSEIGTAPSDSVFSVPGALARSQSCKRPPKPEGRRRLSSNEKEDSRTSSPSFPDIKPMFRTASLRVKQQLAARLSEPLKRAEKTVSKLLTAADDDPDDSQFQHYSVLHGLNNNSKLCLNAEDAGSSSDEDDPEYLELVERETIINRYEQGPEGKDVDAWENPNFDLYTKLDRFGFVHKEVDPKSEAEANQKRRIVKELSREKKWLKMIDQWKTVGLTKKMEDRIWKGIPEKLRIIVWPRLLDAESKKVEKKDVYTNLLLRARLVSKDIKQIDLDINRTYRDHLAFRKRYDVKQKSLLNVLAAYSMYNTEVGYCQGMSQIVALFLMYLDEEDAFWSLHQLMVSPKHTMHGFFVPGFPKLSRFEEHFKKVLKKYKPRIFKHLEKQDIPYIYLTKWWFGCFLDRVPFSLALRLWDVFLVEGDPVLIAMAFNIMKMHEKTIKKLSMETFMEFIQNDIAQNFGYSDDETMHSLRETINKLKSDKMHVPPPAKPEDLSEIPTKALGPILKKPMSTLREEYHEIQSRKSRANSMGRSPYTKRKESTKRNGGPPPVNTCRWNGNASQDSLAQGNKEVPFEIPSRRGMSADPGDHQEYQHQQQQSKRGHPHRSAEDSSRTGIRTNVNAYPAPSPQHLRDERSGQIVVVSRGSDSDESAAVPPPPHPLHSRQSMKEIPRSSTSKPPQSPSRITQGSNYITRIEIGGDDVSVI